MLYTDLASRAVSEAESVLLAVELPWQTRGEPITDLIASSKKPHPNSSQPRGKSSDTALIFHTSGTSSGLPKPISQTHRLLFGVLPVLDGRDSASFSTTPLYHGGIADCMRAWTSRATIWLFPAANVPITTQYVILCLQQAAQAASNEAAATVKYFSSVPYVLQMLAEDSWGLHMLQGMEIVGVGGAALNPEVGKYLVDKGVNLCSRFGSSECGFLLNSHRDYEIDKDWQYLRVPQGTKHLHFEAQNDGTGLSELVVGKEWPHLAKTNRPDGSYATSDLFEPHETTSEAWRYHSRGDSQITLITGKKFDPAPLEDQIVSSSKLIREVLVFGTGRQTPGILIFLSPEGMNMKNSELEGRVWEVIKQVNAGGQDHTRIPRSNLLIMFENERVLERSSKGTLLRGAAEKRFTEDINWCYSTNLTAASPSNDHKGQFLDDSDIHRLVRSTILDAIETDEGLSDGADFYAQGINSTTCTQIRAMLQKNFIQGRGTLPWNVVYDCGNVNRLSQFIINFRNGTYKPEHDEETEMVELVERFSELRPNSNVPKTKPEPKEGDYVVLLTGATGALGAYILDFLRNSPLVSQVICLVRAVDHSTARSRVSLSLVKRKKALLDIEDMKVWCSPSRLNHTNLSLPETELSYFQQSVTHVIHAAWAVNFSLPLKSFVDGHISGLQNLLNFSASCSNVVHFTFCSSVASVLGAQQPPVIEERFSSNPSEAGTIGYSRSKWVAEAICARAAKKLPGKVNVLRIGQLTGDTQNGVWNISEAWPLMLTTIDALDCLPQLDEVLNWLPLDTAATAVIDIAFSTPQNKKKCSLYHLINNASETKWSELLCWIAATRTKPFEVVPAEVWLAKLENFPNKHPAKNLLGMWNLVYGDSVEGEQEKKRTKAVFSTIEAEKKTDAMRTLKPVDQELVIKIWAWVEEEIKAAKAQVYVSLNRFRNE